MKVEEVNAKGAKEMVEADCTACVIVQEIKKVVAPVPKIKAQWVYERYNQCLTSDAFGE